MEKQPKITKKAIESKTKKEFIEIDNKKKVNPVNVIAPVIKPDRHKYKYESGKKVFTFKSKRDLCKGIGIAPAKADELMKADPSSKVKISLI